MLARLTCSIAAVGVLACGVLAPPAVAAPPAKQPLLSVEDVSVAEGDAQTTPAVFEVRLSRASNKTVTVDFATADASATSPGDYAAVSGTLAFAPGETDKQVDVDVAGDGEIEADETFALRLTNAHNAAIADADAVGTIANDDVAPPPPPPSAATAYQIDPAHTGASADAVAATPSRAWSRDLGGAVSYPLIAGDRVYVTVANTSTYGTKLYALDAATGETVWGPVDLGGTYFWSGIAYDAGLVFAVNYNGVLRAFDAASGTLSWSTVLPGQHAFSSPPTAHAGYVYTAGAGSGGTLYAVRQVDGTVAWTAPVANGDKSSPAVSQTGVYVSYACGRAYDFEPVTGALLWYRSTPCSGGGGKTAVLGDGKLFVRDSSYPAILDAASGAELGLWQTSGPAPTITATSRFRLVSGALRAEDLAAGGERWSFAGDGQLRSAPIVAGDRVFVGSSLGNLYALAVDDGALTWSANVGAGIPAPDEQNVSQPLTGLATAGGLLAVPAGRTLVAYR